MFSRTRLSAATLALVAIAGCGLQSEANGSGNAVQVSPTPAPGITGTTTDGAQFDLASLHGHPAVVDFFGSWCGPCRQEQPDLTALAARYTGRGVHFVGIAMRDETAAVSAFRSEFKIPYPAVVDDSGSIAASYDIAAPPTTVLIDSSGRIVAKYLATVAGMSTQLDSLLQHP